MRQKPKHIKAGRSCAEGGGEGACCQGRAAAGWRLTSATARIGVAALNKFFKFTPR